MPVVLLVNDDPTQLAMVSGLLSKDGFEVKAFETGEEALKACSHQVADLVVSDLNLPGLSGDQLLVKLRSDEFVGYRKVPVILVSASPASPEVQARCQEAAGLLLAPYRIGDLRRQVRQSLEAAPLEENPEQAASAEGADFDEAPLSKLLLAGGVPLARRVADLFLAKTPDYLTQADQALACGEHAKVERLAHSIKGSAGMIGCRRVEMRAQDLEQAASQAAARGDQIRALGEAFESARQWLEGRLA